MTDLPKALNGDERILTIIVSAKGQSFRMNVMPRWYSIGAVTLSIGVEIVVIPSGWIEFVRNFEPVSRKGVWGRSALKTA